MAEPKPTAEIFNQEIAELESKLAAKKRELLESGMEHPEKDVFKAVVKEHATGEAGPKFNPSVTPTSPAPAGHTATPTAQAKLNTYIALAFTKGIAAAVKEAKKSHDAYFIDLLHDRLADEYYSKLLQARKINQQ